ncbi:carbohydrate ABC transporter permease [Paenibacillus sp. GCM10023252]|uniref:carbohydrate ABC transporter permease n=1 Tax=Paenibacillus sp. GCM10023252 TaxID=3252649 RepID=UPI003609414E
MESYKRNMKVILLFLFPAIAIYTLFSILPIAASFVLSFTRTEAMLGGAMEFVGLNNYEKLLHNDHFWTSLRNIGYFLLLTLLTQIPLGFLFALLLSTKIRGYKLFKTIIFLPQIVSITATSMIWYFILYPNDGVLTMFLSAIGVEELSRNWLVDPNTAMCSIILVNAWVGIGFHMVVFFAAISGIPEDIRDASKIDGVNGWQNAIYLVMPLVWESVKICVIIVVTAVLKTFDVVFVMTQGGPNGQTHVPTTLLYDLAFRYDNFGGGSAIAVVIFLLSITLTVLSLKLMRRDVLQY